jgi:hypothetical protein
MRFGFRKPSLRKSVAARTSLKRYARHSLGLKAPRGWGWLTNPKRAAYNRIYNRTTFGWQDLLRLGSRRGRAQGCLVAIAVPMAFAAAVVAGFALMP